MKFLIISCLVLLGSSLGFAGDGQSMMVSSDTKQVRFFKDATGYHIATSDGREMTLYEYVRPAQYIKLNLKQIENTCNPNQELANCEFNIGVAPFHYLMIWTKHPDATKIGSLVGNGQFNEQLFYYHTLSFPSLAGLFSPDRLVCDNYIWMEGMKKTTKGSLIVDSWSSEFMFANFETGVNENQTLANGFEIILKPLSQAFEVESVRSDYSAFEASSAPYISAQVSNLNFLNTNNEICQVSFESSLGNARAVIGSPYFNEIDMKNIKLTTDLVPALYFQLKNEIQSKIQELKNSLAAQGGHQ